MVKHGILTPENLGFDNKSGHGAGYHGIIQRDTMMLTIGIGAVPHFQINSFVDKNLRGKPFPNLPNSAWV